MSQVTDDTSGGGRPIHAHSRLPVAVFPGLVLGPALITALLTALSIPPPLAMTAVVITLIAFVATLERRRPARRAWKESSRGETVTDLTYIALASVPDRLARVAVEAAAVSIVALVGTTAMMSSSEATMMELLARALLAFVVADLGKYLIHRLSHENPWLWRFHLAHHQPARLSALNALRLHPVNMAYNAAIDTAAILVFGVGPELAAILATIRATVGVVQHANLDLESGRQWLVNAPSYHAVHHDANSAQANYNYASTLLVWDRLFGTLRRAPRPDMVGVVSTDHRLPAGYFGQLLYPFCGARLDTTCVFAQARRLIE